jgi:hypothetical protein
VKLDEANPCVRCGQPVDIMQQYETFIMDLPPACKECEEAVSNYVAQRLPFWPDSWYGDYKWDRKADRFVSSQEWTG